MSIKTTSQGIIFINVRNTKLNDVAPTRDAPSKYAQNTVTTICGDWRRMNNAWSKTKYNISCYIGITSKYLLPELLQWQINHQPFKSTKNLPNPPQSTLYVDVKVIQY